MITDVPTADDFHQAGIAYLNLAWLSAIELGLQLHDSVRESDEGTCDDVPDEYWRAAQRQLATSMSLLQQGVEFLIKGRIVSVSPYLLIDGLPREWPRGCNKQDTPFATFKTLDAQDLIRAHDTVYAARFTPDFVTRFEQLRIRRNSIMHTVDPTLQFTATEVLGYVLEFSETLVGPRQWSAIRAKAIEAEPSSVTAWGYSNAPRLARELLYVLDVLQPAQLKRYFGVNPKQRMYYCESCQCNARKWGLRVITAQLKPNRPTSTTVHCFVCQSDSTVVRKACRRSGCHGNVFDLEWDVCLTCYDEGQLGVESTPNAK